MKKTMDSGSRPPRAVYMRDFFVGGRGNLAEFTPFNS